MFHIEKIGENAVIVREGKEREIMAVCSKDENAVLILRGLRMLYNEA